MNKQQRRKSKRNIAADAWSAGLEALQAESGGALVLQVVRPPEAVKLIASADAGDMQAVAFLQAFNYLLRQIETSPPDRAPVCVACGLVPARHAFNVALAMPDSTTRGHALGLLVCWPCGSTVEAIKRHAVEACREIWPDIRQIRQTHATGGRA